MSEENTINPFLALGIAPEILPALEAKGFTQPSDIQKLAIPLLLSGEKDVVGQALTGTGKTAAYGLPVLQTLTPGEGVRALILSPTRELSIQIADELKSLAGEKKLKIAPFFGGQPIGIQLGLLSRGIDIAVGTPGRIMDLYRRGKLPLDQLKFAVLDEADEMLDMGFVDDIREILSVTNADKRMLLFSATMPPEILQVAQEFMRPGYETVRAGTEATNTKLTEQYFYEVRRENKIDALARIIDATPELYAMVFCRTRADVDEVTEKLTARGYRMEALHGEISQSQRLRVIEGFKQRKFPLLIATDVAARGIDVNDLSHVINFSLPQNSETYIHRIGRTGRAGSHGVAVTFATPSELRKVRFIERDIGAPIPMRKLPEISDVIEAKKARFANALAEIIDAGGHQEYLNFAEELATFGSHPAEVIAAMLKLHFKSELSTAGYAEIAPNRADSTGMKRLFLFAGRNDGLTVPDLLREIADRSGVRGHKLGRILFRADKTFIEASPDDAEKILRAFAGDPDWRFKYDEKPEERAKRRDRREKTERSEEKKPRRTEKREKTEKPAEKKPRKPLRDALDFWEQEAQLADERPVAPTVEKKSKKFRKRG